MVQTTRRVIGIDEVGRGAWAGPVCVGAVLLDSADGSIAGLADSKVISKKRREEVAHLIRRQAVAIGMGWASARYIDEHGMTLALRRAARIAFDQIAHYEHDEVIIDGTSNFIDPTPATVLPKADALISAVSAGSIVAKVARDAYMGYVDDILPGYGFNAHAGYGTAAHRAAIAANGVTAIHRVSFKPLQQYATRPVSDNKAKQRKVSSGAVAEAAAAQYVESVGYEVIATNWKNRYCEIDIIATRGDYIHFFEVKYRRSGEAGSGFDYITNAKRRQMRFAAGAWRSVNSDYRQLQPVLSAIELSGTDFTVDTVIEDISR